MALNFKSYAQIVTDQVQAIQAYSSQLIDFTIGSILRALTQSIAGVVLWLQGLILKLLTTTRASTCQTIEDLDTWLADYGFKRKQAVAASGSATFSRFTPTLQAVVPVGSTVQTADGSVIFSVTLDTSNANYNAGLNGYVLDINVSSISVPVAAVVPGISGNLAANTLNTIVTPIPGVDTVTNPDPFVNGQDLESNPDAINSFILYLGGLAKANYTSFANAIDSVPGITDYEIIENKDTSGNTVKGFVFSVIDNGTTTSIPTDLINTVLNAMAAVRGLTITVACYGRTIVSVNVSAQIVIDPTYVASDLITIATNALETYMDTLGIGETLYFYRVVQVIIDSSPGILTATNVLVNGATSDITITNVQAIKAGTVTITQA